MFTLRVDDEIELQLLEKHHKEELYQLLDQNRNHLRKWLPWVDGTKSADAYDEIFPMWLKKFAEEMVLKVAYVTKESSLGW